MSFFFFLSMKSKSSLSRALALALAVAHAWPEPPPSPSDRLGVAEGPKCPSATCSPRCGRQRPPSSQRQGRLYTPLWDVKADNNSPNLRPPCEKRKWKSLQFALINSLKILLDTRKKETHLCGVVDTWERPSFPHDMHLTSLGNLKSQAPPAMRRVSAQHRGSKCHIRPTIQLQKMTCIEDIKNILYVSLA